MSTQQSLRERREARGWSVGDLASVAGVSASTVRRGEAGRKIRFFLSACIAKALRSDKKPAAVEKKPRHEFTTEEARAAGRKGGQKTAADKKHMSDIGKLGGWRRGKQMSADAAARRQNANKLPPVSVLSIPSEEDWDPELETIGTPITGDEDAREKTISTRA